MLKEEARGTISSLVLKSVRLLTKDMDDIVSHKLSISRPVSTARNQSELKALCAYLTDALTWPQRCNASRNSEMVRHPVQSPDWLQTAGQDT